MKIFKAILKGTYYAAVLSMLAALTLKAFAPTLVDTAITFITNLF